MKKTSLVLATIVIVISMGWTLNYITHNGQFTKWSHTALERELFEDGKAYYLDYLFKWEGFGNPTLEKVEFIKNDGNIVAKEDDEHFMIKAFVSEEQRGMFDEESALKEGITEKLIPVKDYKVNNGFILVLRAQVTDNVTDNDINSVRITYKTFGIVQFQHIPFDDGIISEE